MSEESGTPEAILSAEEVEHVLRVYKGAPNARALVVSHKALRAEVERLTAERDAALDSGYRWIKRAQAAEARVASLTAENEELRRDVERGATDWIVP